LAEKFASRITSKFSRRDRPKPQISSQRADRLSDQVTYSNAFVALCRTRARWDLPALVARRTPCI